MTEPGQQERERLTVWVCPECGELSGPDPVICAHNLTNENECIEVVPRSQATALAGALEELVEASAAARGPYTFYRAFRDARVALDLYRQLEPANERNA